MGCWTHNTVTFWRLMSNNRELSTSKLTVRRKVPISVSKPNKHFIKDLVPLNSRRVRQNWLLQKLQSRPKRICMNIIAYICFQHILLILDHSVEISCNFINSSRNMILGHCKLVLTYIVCNAVETSVIEPVRRTHLLQPQTSYNLHRNVYVHNFIV